LQLQADKLSFKKKTGSSSIIVFNLYLTSDKGKGFGEECEKMGRVQNFSITTKILNNPAQAAIVMPVIITN
jgi:hypothetical protein